MAKTNFALLDDPAKTVWARETWKQARELTFVAKFMGTSENSMIHRITALTKSERGDNAIVTLVPDMKEDGITGDNEFGENTAALTAHQDTVVVDQLRQAVKNTGRINDQKSIVNFREKVRNNLKYWLSDRIDQMAFLSLAGLSYAVMNNGAVRPNQGTDNLSNLAFNTPLAATSERHVAIKAGGVLAAGNTATMTTSDTIGYKHIVRLQTLTSTSYLRGIKSKGGMEVFHLFLHPEAMASLKLDQDFIDNCRHAGVRGSENTLFSGGDSYVVDGMYIHSFRHVPTNLGAVTKWGVGTNVKGCMGLLCGAQALGFIDLDTPIWDERDHFDYGNSIGISYGKIFGMKKMQFKDAKGSANGAVKQDYGVIRVDMAI